MHFVFCQISNKLINPDAGPLSDQYYESLYAHKEKDGYYRHEHFWELPLWIGEATYALQEEHDCSLHIVTDVNEPLPMLWEGLKTQVVYCFSVLDVNRAIVLDIINRNPYREFAVGGYIDGEQFISDLSVFVHATSWYDSLSNLCDVYNIDYKYGVDWSLFAGVWTIPRLTMSYGCTNKCTFCTVPDKVTPVDCMAITQQVRAMKDLRFKLVYLNDKTFGQCDTHHMLYDLYLMIKAFNPDFRGFIVQTTCAEVLKHSAIFWESLCIKVVELGIETFNDKLLAKYNKPQNERTIARAVDKLHKAHIDTIANVVLGFPGETMRTYGKTLSFLHYFPFYALNIYTLALYQGTRLAKDIDGDNEADANELAEIRSFWTSQEKADFDSASPLFYHLAIDKVVR